MAACSCLPLVISSVLGQCAGCAVPPTRCCWRQAVSEALVTVASSFRQSTTIVCAAQTTSQHSQTASQHSSGELESSHIAWTLRVSTAAAADQYHVDKRTDDSRLRRGISPECLSVCQGKRNEAKNAYGYVVPIVRFVAANLCVLNAADGKPRAYKVWVPPPERVASRGSVPHVCCAT